LRAHNRLMNSAGQLWACLLLALLYAVLFFLQKRFPGATRRARAGVLAAAVIVFLSSYGFLTHPHAPEQTVGAVQHSAR
jgi:hypothetical protein